MTKEVFEIFGDVFLLTSIASFLACLWWWLCPSSPASGIVLFYYPLQLVLIATQTLKLESQNFLIGFKLSVHRVECNNNFEYLVCVCHAHLIKNITKVANRAYPNLVGAPFA